MVRPHHAVAVPHAVAAFYLPAEKDDICFRAHLLCPCHEPSVAAVKHEMVVKGRNCGRFPFCAVIGLFAVVPVEMVLREVEHGRRLRLEQVDCFELKAGYFGDHKTVRGHGIYHIHQGNPDVSRNGMRFPAAAMTAPSMLTVVLFPLDPVTARNFAPVNL